MRSLPPRRVLPLVVLCLTLSGVLPAPLFAQDATPVPTTTVVPADVEVEGARLGDWLARWWQRAASFPLEVHPFLDETGDRCGYVQNDPVFFLQGPPLIEPGTAITCVVPAGTAIYVPIISAGCSTVEPPPFFGRDETELRTCATTLVDAVTEVSVTIDGQAVPDLGRYRASTPLHTLTFAEENLFEVPAGIAQSVADGYQLIIESLPEGEHEIQVYAEIEGEAHTDTTFRVIVEAPQVIEPDASPATSPEATPVT